MQATPASEKLTTSVQARLFHQFETVDLQSGTVIFKEGDEIYSGLAIGDEEAVQARKMKRK